MNTQLRQAKDAAHGLTIRDGAKRAGWVIAGVGAALMMTSAASAAPAPGTAVVLNPVNLPDLSVSMNAPATVQAYNNASFTVSVTNSAPQIAIVGSGRTVRAHVDLTGMTAVSAQSDAGLTCTVSVANAQTPWSVVDCIGTLAYGASTTILVTFAPGPQINSPNACNSNFYCGQPTYADASVQYWSGSASERSTSNNRAIARIDNIDCLT